MKKRKGTALLLIMCLIGGLLPNMGGLSVQAKETKDEYGHTASIPSSFDAGDGINPYGAGNANFNPMVELGVYDSKSGYSAERIYNLDGNDGNILHNSVFTSAAYNKKDETSFSSSFSAMRSVVSSSSQSTIQYASGVTLDAGKSGRDDYTVYFGYKKSTGKTADNRPTLIYYKNSDGSSARTEKVIGSGDYGWVNSLDYVESEGYNPITAGDFDDDGKETVIVYDAAKGNLCLKEYSVAGFGLIDSYPIGSSSDLTDYYDVSLNELQSSVKSDGDTLCNTAMVSLYAENVDNDDADELIVTVSLPDMDGGKEDDIINSASVLLVMDKVSGGWEVTYKRQLSDVYTADHTNSTKKNAAGGWYMRSSASVAGDVDNDGNMDIVTVGTMADDKRNDDDDVQTSGTVAVITRCNGTSYSTLTTSSTSWNESSGTEPIVPQGYYLDKKASGGKSWVNINSHANMAPVAIGFVRMDGIGTQEYLFVRGTLFQFAENRFQAADLSNNKSADDCLDGADACYRPVIGNFDGNDKGKEQVFFTLVYDKSGNNVTMNIAGWYNDGEKSAMSGSSLHSCEWKSAVSKNDIDNCVFLALTAPDADANDGMVVQYKSKQYTYTKPEIMAILEASPYFEELSDKYYDSTGSTTFGTSSGSGTGTIKSSSTRAGAYMSFEQDISVFGVKIASVEAEASYEAEWSSEVSIETNYEYEMAFTGHQENNSVVLIYTPVVVYTYNVWNNTTKKYDGTMDVTVAEKPEYLILSLDDYNAAAEKSGDPVIGEDIVSCKPGQPETYRNSSTGLDNVVAASSSFTAVNNGSSSVEATITKSTSSSLTTSLTHSVDAKLATGVGGLTIGVSGGYSTGTGKSVTDTSAITRAGSVSDVPKGYTNYGFSWKFISWETMFGTGDNAYKVPVLSYLVTNLKQPPSKPQNITAVADVDAVTLNWTIESRSAAEYEIYRYLEIDPTDQHYYLVGTVDGTKRSFTHTGLKSGTQYQYCMRAVGSDGLTTDYTEPLSIVTISEEGVPRITLQPKDISVLPGADASFSVSAIPSGEYGLSYRWQSSSDGVVWSNINHATSSTLIMENVQADISGTRYRCIVSELGMSESPAFLYSAAATLSVGKADSTTTIVSLDKNSQETTSGTADYIVQTQEEQDRSITAHYEVIIGGETTTYICYKNEYENEEDDDNSIGTLVWYCMEDGQYYMLENLKLSSKTADDTGTYTASADARIQLEILENCLMDAEGKRVTNLSTLHATLPKTVIYDEVSYTVWTAQGVHETGSEELEQQTLKLYQRKEDVSDNAYYVRYENDEGIMTMKALTAVDSYEVTENSVIYTKLQNDTYLKDTLVQHFDDTYEVEDGYTLYGCEGTAEGGSVDMVLYEKGGNYYLDKDGEPLIENAYGTDGLLGLVSENEVKQFGKPSATPETVTIKETVTVGNTKEGEMVTLQAVVDAAGNKSGLVTFYIDNTTTGQNIIQSVQQENGTAVYHWQPATAGIYYIRAVYAGSTQSNPSSSNTIIYYALENPDKVTGYDLDVSQNAQYGDAVTASLVQWDASAGERSHTSGAAYQAYAYPAEGADADTIGTNGFNKTPENWTNGDTLLPGYYLIAAEVNGEQVASKSLTVSKKAITVKAPDFVPISDKGVAEFNLAEYLHMIQVTDSKGDFELTGDYGGTETGYSRLFKLSGAIKATAAVYDISIAYADDGDLKADFLSKYVPTFVKNTLTVIVDSHKVNYSAGSNGKIKGYNETENARYFADGTAITDGSALIFEATPDSGFMISAWRINGEKVTEETRGATLSGNILKLDALEEDINVTVEFTNNAYTVTYHAGEHGSLSAMQRNTEIVSGTKVAGDSSVVFAAEPEKGYIIKSWTVSQAGGTAAVQYNADNSVYAGKTLTMDEMKADLVVAVTFEPVETYSVHYQAVNTNGEKATGVGFEVSGLNENGQAQKTAEINIHANVAPGVGIQEWQMSTDGVNWKVAGESAEDYHIYNLQADVYLQVVVNDSTGTTYNLYFGVSDSSGQAITTAGELTAVTQEETKLSEGSNTAYIPLYFQYTETDAYEVVEWIVNGKTVQSGCDKLDYQIKSLADNLDVQVIVQKKPQVRLVESQNGTMEVSYAYGDAQVQPSANGYVYTGTSVTIKADPYNGYVVDTINDTEVNKRRENGSKELTLAIMDDMNIGTSFVRKPVVTVPSVEHGTLTVEGTVDGQRTALLDGQYVDYGSLLKIILTPDTGYAVAQEVGITYNYSDGTGLTTDEMYYTTEEIAADYTAAAQFEVLEAYAISYDTVITTGSNANGSLKASARRKDMAVYNKDALTDGAFVYEGSSVTITAMPDSEYRVLQWWVNGQVYEQNESAYHGNELVLDDIHERMDVQVQFIHLGESTVIQAEAHGKVISAIAGGVDQIGNISTGFILTPDAAVEITAEPDTGYEVRAWMVNGTVAQESGNVYTYTAASDQIGAFITVSFRQVQYPVSWKGTDGTVTAAGYEGERADIHGGTTVTFYAQAKDGYEVSGWKVNGQLVDGQAGTSFIWTVPNGQAEIPAVIGYEVEGVFKKANYKVTYTDPANGTLQGSVNPGSVVEGESAVDFTVAPDQDYTVSHWLVNGEIVDSQGLTHSLVITEDTDVSVVLVPASYEIAYAVQGNGTVEGVDKGTAMVSYRGEITLTAAADDYWFISGWSVNGKWMTDGLSEDKTQLTITDIREAKDVTVIAIPATRYKVAYRVVNGGGTLTATTGGETLTLDEGQYTSVAGGSELVFKASPDDGKMVKSWKINGVAVENHYGSRLIVESLDKAITVEVEYEDYEGYEIPQSGIGYEVTDIIREPSDVGKVDEIRRNGTLTFTVKTADGYHTLEKLVVNGYNCITGELEAGLPEAENCASLDVRKNDGESYTIIMKGIDGTIGFQAQAHKHELVNVPGKAPTYTEDGNLEYWTCHGCGTLFLNPDTLEETTLEEVTIPKYSDITLKLNASSKTVEYKKSITLKKTITPTWAAGKKTVWKSSNTAVAKVSANGKVTAVGIGTAKITCMLAECEQVKTTCKITVKDSSVLSLKAKNTKNSVTLTWSKVPSADGYLIYGARCSGDMKLKKTITTNSRTSWTQKKLKSATQYKYYVRAYRIVNGKKKIVKYSNMVHRVTNGGTYTNMKKIKLNKTKYTMSPGKIRKLSPKAVYLNKDKKIVAHMKGYTYKSGNTAVATVTAKGRIKAVGKGTCYIYIYANNGVYRKVKVTVK